MTASKLQNINQHNLNKFLKNNNKKKKTSNTSKIGTNNVLQLNQSVKIQGKENSSTR